MVTFQRLHAMERLSCACSFFLPGALTWLEACLVCGMAELTMLSGDVSARCRFLFCIQVLT